MYGVEGNPSYREGFLRIYSVHVTDVVPSSVIEILPYPKVQNSFRVKKEVLSVRKIRPL